MNKIRITEIADECYAIRGFDERGCYGHPCDDMCCIGGVEVDREAHDLIFRHRDEIEGALGARLEDCFLERWNGDEEFPGGDSIDSAEGRDDYCMFHAPRGKGCVLYALALRGRIPIRCVPVICRLYPLTFGDGLLYVSEHLEATCNCLARDNRTSKTLLETQREAMDDIFEYDDAVREELEAARGG